MRVRLIGSLRATTNFRDTEVELVDSGTVSQLIQILNDGYPGLRNQLVNAALMSLILVGGTEIGNLDGLSTVLEEGVEVVFVPVIHGG